jgi:hypothetical protein
MNKKSFSWRNEIDKHKFIYIPPQVTREKVDLIFPWNGKEYKVKEIPYKGVK